MAQKDKKMRFEKVVEWDKLNEGLTGKDLLIDGILTVIPGVNIFMGLISIFASLTYRKVYWRKIK